MHKLAILKELMVSSTRCLENGQQGGHGAASADRDATPTPAGLRTTTSARPAEPDTRWFGNDHRCEAAGGVWT